MKKNVGKMKDFIFFWTKKIKQKRLFYQFSWKIAGSVIYYIVFGFVFCTIEQSFDIASVSEINQNCKNSCYVNIYIALTGIYKICSKGQKRKADKIT